jgi:translation initiation factor 2A
MASFHEMTAQVVPPTRFLIRSREGLQCFNGPPTVTPDDGVLVTPFDTTNALHGLESCVLKPQYSSDGRYVCLVREMEDKSILMTIHNSESGILIGNIPVSNADYVEFSPRGTYLVTWRPPKQGENNTLQVWNVLTQELISSYSQKSRKDDVLQWTLDESFCCHLVTNEVRIMNGMDLKGGLIAKLYHKGVSQYKIAPTTGSDGGCIIGVFQPEKNGKPASAALYTYIGTGDSVAGPHAHRTMFSASEANMQWNAPGTCLLIHTSTDVDTSGTSYYGASGLYVLGSEQLNYIAEKVNQSKDGPIHHVAWSPIGDKFVLAAGHMPSRTTMYNVKAEMVFQFGEAHRNEIIWSPHGRFLCIAGFGNLAGEMDFYDTNKSVKKIGTNTAHCSVTYEWSPDSRYFMTSVLAPRMNVDNKYQIFKYNGVGPIIVKSYERALDCMWQPMDSKLYPNRGQSPRREGDAKPIAVAPVAAKPAAYRPPGARGMSGGLADKLKRESAPVGKVKPGESGGKTFGEVYKIKPRAIPGMAPAEQVKIAKTVDPAIAEAKKEAKKKADKERKEAAAKAKAAEEAAAAEAAKIAALPKAIDDLTNEEKEKRAKNLRKKLKNIEELRVKLAGGAILNEDQMNKIASVDEIQADLAKLAI